MTNFYSEDLAYVHDTGFSNFAEHAAKSIVKTLNAHLNKKGLVVDLGCGSGVVAKELANNLYQVHGIDSSSSLIEIAKKRVPSGTFVVGSFFDAPIPSCAAVISTSECLNYLSQDSSHESNLKKLFDQVYGSLQQGGLFIFDMIEPGNRPDCNHIVEHEDWTMFVHICEDAEINELTRDVTLFRKLDDLYRKNKEVHHVKLYPHQLIVKWLEGIGFQVSLFQNYNELKLDEHHFGFLCIKPV
ncbi:TPA: trans-aconitate 2-methyltransferase [Legionella pneumophila]